VGSRQLGERLVLLQPRESSGSADGFAQKLLHEFDRRVHLPRVRCKPPRLHKWDHFGEPDIHEAMVTAVRGIKFGLAFCESSGKCLVRWTGTDPATCLYQPTFMAASPKMALIRFRALNFVEDLQRQGGTLRAA